MRSKTIFAIITVTIAVSIISYVLGVGSDFGRRGQGMGGPNTNSNFWLVLIAVPLVIAVIFFGYTMVFPDLGERADSTKSVQPLFEKKESVLDGVLRVLKDDERKVMETLVAENGTMLQKDIRWKTGYSRVKTHRILHRLIERGIVTAEKYHNTNKIQLADWIESEN